MIRPEEVLLNTSAQKGFLGITNEVFEYLNDGLAQRAVQNVWHAKVANPNRKNSNNYPNKLGKQCRN